MTARLAPGDRRSIGLPNWVIARVAGAVAGSEPPKLFTTLGRHRRLFRRWLVFAAALMPRGSLPRRDTELVILRVAYRCGCSYESEHHRRLARAAGVVAAEIAAAESADAPVGEGRAATLLRAVDELHDDQRIGDATWQLLAAHLTEQQLIELPILVGHYTMLAMLLNSLQVTADEPARRGRVGAVLYRMGAR